MPHELFKYASLRRKNKRVFIITYKSDSGLSVVVTTKRLIGDWKDRNILESTVHYGLETFLALFDVSNMLMRDHEFLKYINPQLGVVRKEKYELSSNIKYK